MTDFELLSILIAGGLGAGLIAGFFGLGGGAVLVPLFLWLLPKIGAVPAVKMHQAVATSLAIVAFNSFSASLSQYKSRNLNLSPFKIWLPFVLIGVLIAGFLFKHVPVFLLNILFMSYLLLCVLYMYFKKEERIESDHVPPKISILRNSIAGIFVGVISTFLGIGGGTFTVPYYVANHYPLKKAIAISSVTGFLISLVGALLTIISGYHVSGLAKYSLGFVNILAFIIIAPFSMWSSSYGVKINHLMQDKTIKIAYCIFLLLVIAFVYYFTIVI